MGIPAVAIPWPLSSFPGGSVQESAGRLINAYAEPLGQTGPAPQVWRRSPGLTQFGTSVRAGFRGGLLVNGTVYAAYSGEAVTIASNGAIADIAALAGTKRLTWAANQKAPPDIQAVDVDNGAFAVTGGSVTAFNGGGNLPQPNSVCAQDGYFFWGIADKRIFAAGPNSTTVNSQTFVQSQGRSGGALQRVIAYKGLLWAFCTYYTEVFSDTANAFPGFPYTRLPGGVIDRGLLQPTAIAGMEDGFGDLYFVADDYSVRHIGNDLQPEKISPPDLDRLIEAANAAGQILEMCCYTFAGRSIVELSSPSWTWAFNINTSKWFELSSDVGGVNPFGRRRVTCSVLAFGKWLVGDTVDGRIGYIDDAVQQEYGQPLRFRMESGPVQKFPNRTRVGRADFDFVTGVGQATGTDPIQTDPSVLISWSDDGGYSWSVPLIRKLGRQAAGKQRVFCINLGATSAIGRRWRIDISDPVYAGFIGATQQADIREN